MLLFPIDGWCFEDDIEFIYYLVMSFKVPG